MLTKMVEDGEGCNVGIECLGIAEVTNPRFVHYRLDEYLDAVLSSLVSLIVLKLSSPGGFGANAVNMRSFYVDCRVIAQAGRVAGHTKGAP
jgi:hypothetical protein